MAHLLAIHGVSLRYWVATLFVLSVSVIPAQSNASATDAGVDARAKISQLREDQKFASAAALAQELIQRIKQESGDQSDAVAGLETLKQELEQLAELTTRCDRLRAASEFLEAAAAAREILAVELLHYGREHPRVAACRKQCAVLDQEAAAQQHTWKSKSDLIDKLRSQKRTDEALGATVALLKLQRKAFGDRHTEVAETLRRLCKQEEIDGRADVTLPRYEEIVKTLFDVLGEDHWRTAEARLDLRTAKALSLLDRGDQRALAAMRARIGGLDPSSARKDSSVIQRFESELSQVEKSIGTENSLYILMLLTRGDVYSKMGRLADADRTYRRATDLSDQVAGRSHYFFRTALSRLADSRGALADHNTAVGYARQAAELTAQHAGLYSEDYLVRLRTLGTVQYQAGRHPEALASFEKLELLHAEVRGPSHPDTASILLDVAFASYTGHRQARALEYGRRAMQMIRQTKGTANPPYIRSLLLVAQLDDNAGRTEQARAEFEELATVTRQVYPESHPDWARSLAATAGHYQVHGQSAAAAAILKDVLAAQRKSLHDRFSAQAEEQQLELVAATRGTYFGYLTACTELPDHAEATWQQALAWQGIVSRRQALIAAAVADPRFADVRQELQQVVRRLSTTAFRQSGPLGSEQLLKLHQLSRRLNELELQLAEQAGGDEEEVGPQAIVDRLPDDSALIDFVLYNHLVPNRNDERIKFLREPRLLAFVARRNQRVQLVPLGPVDPIRVAAAEWRSLLAAGRGESPQPDSAALPQRRLKRLLWDPLAPHLAGAKLVLYVPDGPISRVPLAALPGEEADQYLIDKYRFITLPSAARAAMKPVVAESQRSVDNSMLLIGDVDFGGPTAGTSLASRMASAQFVPLPGTKREVQSIADLFTKEFPDGKLTLSQQQAASEASFRESASRHRLLHLATHGFCILEDPELLRSADAQGSNDLLNYLETHAPEVLSGIALANVNAKASGAGDQDADDGILTALELSTLDLRHVEVAVLSACESGLGQENLGEGLLGLQRALQIAGVRTTVTSLWKVDDAATETLMTEFYRNLWREKLGPGDALRQAQLTMIDRYDASKRKLQPRGLKLVAPAGAATRRLPPYFWAAFCLSGDGE